MIDDYFCVLHVMMKVDDRTEEELRLEAERLGSFAGMRKIDPSSDGLQSDAAGGPLSPLAEACIFLNFLVVGCDYDLFHTSADV